jgi:predicted permease
VIWPWRRRRREAELDEEIAGHLAMAALDHEVRGASPTEAHYAARRELGNATLVREVTRQIWGGVWLEQLGQDLRLAARSLAHAPGFTATVVVTLALGLGATAAMFGVLDRLLLRAPIGVNEPDQVVRLFVRETQGDRPGLRLRSSFLYQQLHLFDGAESVGSVAFWGSNGTAPLKDDVGSLDARTTMVSGRYFQVLGVRFTQGRPLLLADDSASSSPAAVVSYALWKGRYGGAPSALGKVIHIKGRAYTVVGIAPRGFAGLSNQTVDVWVPVNVAADDLFGPMLHNPMIRMYAFYAAERTDPRIPPARVTGELTLAMRRHLPPPVSTPFGPMDPEPSVVLGSIIPGRAQVELGSVTESLRLSLLVGAVALIVCLIAVANVANLLLLRAVGRRHETGIRLALGVSRWRLVRSILAESLLLASLAGLADAYVASAGGELLRRLLVQEDWAAPLAGLRVFGFVALTAFVVGMVTGLVPALIGGKTDVLASLGSGVRLSARRRSRVRALLMVGQAALTLVLLAGFGLFARSVVRAQRVGFGLDVGHLLVARTTGDEGRASPLNLDELLARVRRLPGVRAAATAETAVPMFSYGVRYLRAEGVASLPNSTAGGGPFFSSIGPGYLETAGLRVLRGRSFAAGEFVAPATVALVSAEMARRLWPGEETIGKCLYIQLNIAQMPPCTSIVGVVQNVRQNISESPLMQYYVPLDRAGSAYAEIVVRTDGDPERLVAPLTAEIKRLRPDLPDHAVVAVPSILDSQFHAWRLGAALFAMFGGLALLVAMVGLYSVVAFDGAQRTHEFGIRIALGARGWEIARLLIGQGLRFGLTGLTVGLVLVLATGRLLATELFHTSAHDPLVLGGVALLLLAGMFVACVLPARAAAHADPRQALQAV